MWRVERRVKEINENASNSGRVMDISQRFSSLPRGAMSWWKIRKKKDFLNQWRATTSSCLVEREREKKQFLYRIKKEE